MGMDSIQVSSVETDLDNPTEEGKDEGGTIKPEHRERLQKEHKKLVDEVTLKHLLPDLHSKGVITVPEYRDLLNQIGAGKEIQAIEQFLLSLHSKSFTDFYLFCDAVIIQQQAPWLCYDLLDVGDWDTLNRVRKQKHKDDRRTLDGYFDIPKYVTKEKLQSIDGNMARMGGDIYTYDEYWEQTTSVEETNTTLSQTVPKDVTTSTELDPHPEAELIYPIQVADERSIPDEAAGFVEADSAFSAEDETKPEWVKNLRKYQLELAEPSLRRVNYIITAPTGSGKTHVASYVIYEHLRKHGDAGRVVFFCPEVELVEQQFGLIKDQFPDHDVDFLVGSKVADKMAIEDMVRTHQIVVVTPAIVDNALANGKIPGFDAFTLMIFDECHHTDGEHAYNKIMSKYLDAKLRKREVRPKLPQVIGMTASLGVGKARGDDEAVLFVMKKCANMDASEIAVVRKNTEELSKFSNDPVEKTEVVDERGDDDPFLKTITDIMKEIEERIIKTLGASRNSLNFPEQKYTQIYRTTLAVVKNELRDRVKERLVVLPCLEFLVSFSWCLDMYRVARPKDAVMMLRSKLDTRPRGKVEKHEEKPEVELWLEAKLQVVLPKLNELCKEGCLEENPRLKKMKEIIVGAFKENPKSRCILFTKTRVSTEALKSWINEDVDMKHLNAERITGRFGITDSQQEQVLQDFKDGKHKILVATSVAEEGLDIQACNLVMRYNYATNEVGRVQTKGRARDMQSQIMNIDSADHVDEVQGKEKLNLHREGLMKSAVNKIRAMKEESFETYRNSIYRFQVSEYRNRYFRRMLKKAQDDAKTKDRFILACFSCSRHMCYSDEIVKFCDASNPFYMCKNPEFDQKIKTDKDEKRVKQIDNFKKQYVVLCNNSGCRWKLGFVFEYKKQVCFPALKGDTAFHFYKMEPNGEKGKRLGKFRKWDETPCKYEEISEEELRRIFEGRTYIPQD